MIVLNDFIWLTKCAITHKQEDKYESEEASTVAVVADTDCTNHNIHVY